MARVGRRGSRRRRPVDRARSATARRVPDVIADLGGLGFGRDARALERGRAGARGALRVGAAAARAARRRRHPRGRARRDGRPALPRGGDPRPRRGRLPRRAPARSVPAGRRAGGAASVRGQDWAPELRARRIAAGGGSRWAGLRCLYGVRKPAQLSLFGRGEAAHEWRGRSIRRLVAPQVGSRRGTQPVPAFRSGGSAPRPPRWLSALRRCPRRRTGSLEARRLFHRAVSPGHGAADPLLPARRRAHRPRAAAVALLRGRRRGARGPAGGRRPSSTGWWSRTTSTRCRSRTPSTAASATACACARGGRRRRPRSPRARRSSSARCSRAGALVGQAHALRRPSCGGRRRLGSPGAARPAARALPGLGEPARDLRPLRLPVPAAERAAPGARARARGAPPPRPARARRPLPPGGRGVPARAARHAASCRSRHAETQRARLREIAETALQTARRGQPAALHAAVGAGERRVPRDGAGAGSRREAAAGRAVDARALRGELRPRREAATPASRTTPSRSRSTSATAARCASRERSTASTGARTAPSCCATTRPGARRGTTAASSAAAGSSRSRSTSWPPQKLFPGEPVVEAFLDYVDGGRQVAFDPEHVTGTAFRALLRGLVDAIAQRRLRAGAHRLRLVRLHGGVRAQGPAPAPPGATSSRDPRCSACCGCGTSDERLPPRGRGRARARAPRPRHEPRAGGGRGHRQDDAARGPHRGAGARGRRASRRDRGRHLHRERGHHHEAAPARAAGAGARRTPALAGGRARARGRGPRRARARAGLDDPRAVRGDPAGAAARVRRACPASAWPTRPRPTRSSPRPGRSGWRSGSSGGDDVLLDALERGIPLEGDGWGERTSLRGLARTLVEQRDLEPLVGRRRRRSRRPGGASCWQQAARGARARGAGARGRRARGAPAAARGVRGGGALPRRPATRSPTCCASTRSRRTSATSRTGPRPRRSPRRARSRPGPSEARPRWTRRCGADLHGRLVRALSGVVAHLRARARPSAACSTSSTCW